MSSFANALKNIIGPQTPVPTNAGVSAPNQPAANTINVIHHVVTPTTTVSNGPTLKTNAPGSQQFTAGSSVPGSDPVNHDFINSLASQIQNNTSAALESAQQQTVGAQNSERLAAGANTLGGNFAVEGNAGNQAQAQLAQGANQQMSAAQAGASEQNQADLGNALSEESSQLGNSTSADVQQNVQNIQDLLAKYQEEATAAGGAMSTNVQTEIDNLNQALNQYAANINTNNVNNAHTILGSIMSGISQVASFASKGA